MFVSVVIDPGSIETAQSLVNLLVLSGFEKKLKSCWENVHITENDLISLKKNIDNVTDYYDKIRIYQYPVDGIFAITELDKKKWKKYKMNISTKKSN